MEQAQNKSYWNAAGKAGAIFGFIVFLITIIGGYITIHSEPSGSFLMMYYASSAIGCLIALFGGVLAVKFYINEHGKELKVGRGAVIGLFTGVFIALVSVVLSMIWPVIDSSYIDNLQNAMIANIEASTMFDSAMKDEMIDATYTQMQNYHSAGNILQMLGMGAVMYGLLNVLSGMLAAKVMGKAPEEEL
ncbi:DUF4199 family protein [Balneolales bacterium ANBcel1]|nr:DUF4199 family protein [Balneolales bacterium ANBcel1]